jgi:hypothetical protein
MLLKTDLAHQQALLDCLKSHHPYQTPELLVLPVTSWRQRLPLMAQRIITLILLLCSTSATAGLFDAPGARTLFLLTRLSPLTFSRTARPQPDLANQGWLLSLSSTVYLPRRRGDSRRTGAAGRRVA